MRKTTLLSLLVLLSLNICAIADPAVPGHRGVSRPGDSCPDGALMIRPCFAGRMDLGILEHDPITEASGLAASRKNDGVFWTHNDSGGENCIFAFNSEGIHLGVYYIDGCPARDWEDMTVSPGPEGEDFCIYVGDIGDNNGQYEYIFVYRVPEPDVDRFQDPVIETLCGAETITFQYPDGSRDAETLMVDPLTYDIYIVSKREINVHVYMAPYPQSTTDPVTLEHVSSLLIGMTVGGDISPSGLEILIKTYSQIFYWSRDPWQNLWDAFDDSPETVPYIVEPQGEAVGWHPDNMGYYTTSEEAFLIPAHLYFYPRYRLKASTLP